MSLKESLLCLDFSNTETNKLLKKYKDNLIMNEKKILTPTLIGTSGDTLREAFGSFNKCC